MKCIASALSIGAVYSAIPLEAATVEIFALKEFTAKILLTKITQHIKRKNILRVKK
jgi:hypothetical protein